MNVTIQNIALISTAAEYFDRATGASWKLRSTMVSMAVWATRSYLTLSQRADADLTNVCRAAVVMATIRKWVHTIESDGFSLDLTTDSVRRAMGLNRELDIHAATVPAEAAHAAGWRAWAPWVAGGLALLLLLMAWLKRSRAARNQPAGGAA